MKVNVLNRPYGEFPWMDMPEVANENWFNAHNGYGDMADLEAATLEDAQAFFRPFTLPRTRRWWSSATSRPETRRTRESATSGRSRPRRLSGRPDPRAAAAGGAALQPDRQAGHATGPGFSYHTPAYHAGVLRHGAPRPNPRSRRLLPAAPGTRPERAHRCRGWRGSTSWATCSTTADPMLCDGSPLRSTSREVSTDDDPRASTR